jgi:hypothetical protein
MTLHQTIGLGILILPLTVTSTLIHSLAAIPTRHPGPV